jgi:leucyl-tRNA synthetase
MIYCDKCGIVPVPEKDLPIELPEKVKFGEGNPLATNKEFIECKCPKCKSKAKRETDTMDTFFDSSWYYLRYCDNKNSKEAFDKKKADYWMPVDQYIGGAEHACMHLIYARFFTKALRDLGFLNFDEPFTKLFNQGMLHGTDGEKMSKSKGNVILPEEVSKNYGMDTARLFLMSQASPDKDTSWSQTGIDGSLRIVKRIINYFENVRFGKSSEIIESKLNKTIKEYSKDIENFDYNLGIIKLRALFEAFEKEREIAKEDLGKFLKLLSPICPHIAEELWSKLGNKSFISLESWPIADEKKINLKLEQQEQAIEKTLSDIQNIFKIIKEKENKEIKKVYLYVIPPELAHYKEARENMKNSLGVDVEVFAVNDAKKFDPENKSGKAKMGKPAIYVE